MTPSSRKTTARRLTGIPARKLHLPDTDSANPSKTSTSNAPANRSTGYRRARSYGFPAFSALESESTQTDTMDTTFCFCGVYRHISPFRRLCDCCGKSLASRRPCRTPRHWSQKLSRTGSWVSHTAASSLAVPLAPRERLRPPLSLQLPCARSVPLPFYFVRDLPYPFNLPYQFNPACEA